MGWLIRAKINLYGDGFASNGCVWFAAATGVHAHRGGRFRKRKYQTRRDRFYHWETERGSLGGRAGGAGGGVRFTGCATLSFLHFLS